MTELEDKYVWQKEDVYRDFLTFDGMMIYIPSILIQSIMRIIFPKHMNLVEEHLYAILKIILKESFRPQSLNSQPLGFCKLEPNDFTKLIGIPPDKILKNLQYLFDCKILNNTENDIWITYPSQWKIDLRDEVDGIMTLNSEDARKFLGV